VRVVENPGKKTKDASKVKDEKLKNATNKA
jgi:hypothetical protein